MKTFKDLEFEKSPRYLGVKMGKLSFPNNYGIFVISGLRGARTSTNRNYDYEVTVIKMNNLCFGHPIMNNFIGYCNKAKITKIMKQIQELGKNKNSKDKVKT